MKRCQYGFRKRTSSITKPLYDLAVQTDGDTLPVVFKFGTDTEPVYKTFTTIEELTKFYTCAMKYIQDTLRQGWKKKRCFRYDFVRVNSIGEE